MAHEELFMLAEPIADIAILIVGFRNPADIKACLSSLSKATPQPAFDVFICENGGEHSFQQLVDELVAGDAPCRAISDTVIPTIPTSSRFKHVRRLRLRARSSEVWVGCAVDNLGYAGGINAWLHQLRSLSGWKGVWVLNPDTEPEAGALAALVERARCGRKGMVGSTIMDIERADQIRCRGGLRWRRLAARTISIGLGDPLGAPHDLVAIEAAMDSPTGASMFVTRTCIEKIGPMDESYFLFFEDLDWGLRAKACGLGYASDSVVWHKRGTTTGSAKNAANIPVFSVYLEHRNAIHFVRKHFPWTLPTRIIVSLLYAGRFLINRAPNNFLAAFQGMLAGLRGETGPKSR
jgi:GT2 family glycosyltransferase